MPIDVTTLKGLSVEELEELIKEARRAKSQKATPSVKINGYVASVGKHVTSALEAIKKLSMAEGVPQKKWDEVTAQLQRLQLDRFREEAEKVKLTPRTPRGGGRRRK